MCPVLHLYIYIRQDDSVFLTAVLTHRDSKLVSVEAYDKDHYSDPVLSSWIPDGATWDSGSLEGQKVPGRCDQWYRVML